MTKTLSIELFAGPGSGKSTTATGVFSLSKMHGLNTEYVSEYAKDRAWEGTLTTCYNPFYIAGKQYHRQFKLMNQVDFMVTDSPMLQQMVYNDDPEFHEMCRILANRFEHMSFFIKRVKEFNPKGRAHDLEQAIEIDEKIKKMLADEKRDFIEVEGNYEAPNIILYHIMAKLNKPVLYSIMKI